jgi:phosphoribosylanthranilate isomerase
MIDMVDEGNEEPRVKICGLTNLEDAQTAVDAGADLLGFIFYEKSPRYIDPRTVASIVSALKPAPRSPLLALRSTPEGEARSGPRFPLFVGVFVNPSLEQVTLILNHCDLDLAQLHGEEAPELLAHLAKRAFKALRPRSAEEAEADGSRYARLGPSGGPDLLVDAYHPDARGGTGQAGDWNLAAGLARRHRLLLAGGLTPDNVASAIRQVRPWGVDVASGVEAAPGRKDHDQVRAFIAAAKESG